MIKIVATIFLILFLVVSMWLSFGLICNKANKTAENHVVRLIFLLDEFYQNNNSYPNDISAFLKKDRLSKEKVFAVISVPEIKFELEAERKDYKLYYYEFPLGPFHTYSSKKKKWYYEE